MDIHDATRSYERWMGQHIEVWRPDLVHKHKKKMTKSPFLFLRATFYRWMQVWPTAFEPLSDAPAVLAVGDLHIENFGTWRDAEGRLVWGVNDVDEASRLLYTQDLVRLATSALLAIRARHFASSGRDACEAILTSARQAWRRLRVRRGRNRHRPARRHRSPPAERSRGFPRGSRRF